MARANRPASQQASEKDLRTKVQGTRAREPWGMFHSLNPGQVTLTFLQHISRRYFLIEAVSPQDFGEMFPVICESFWLSFRI